ncbi:MAG: tyrosine-protein phosphatase [Prevotella sp.]|nr:tyrosine-protein phosphatase [Prevotella sp.]
MMKKKYLLSLLLLGIGLAGQAQTGEVINVNLENESVKRYMDEVTYLPEDESRITNYHNINLERKDLPNPAVIPVPAVEADTLTITVWSGDWAVTKKGIAKGSTQVEVYNLVPMCNYSYQVLADKKVVASGEIHTTGQVRMIALPSISNVRDLGGWPTADGRTIKYGRLYRGSEMNGLLEMDSVDLVTFTTDLAIGAEIDMRAWYNDGPGISVPGFLDANHTSTGEVPSFLYTNDSGQTASALFTYMWQRRWKNEFNFIIQNLMAGRNIYMHCVWGANRTGYLALLLEGLLGVSYSDMVKDYELTTFSNRLERKEKIDSIFIQIDSLPGNTLQEKFNHYFVNVLKVKQSDVDYLFSVMLEGTTPGVNPPTAIESLVGRDLQSPTISYGLDGRRQQSRRKGIVLQRQSDGTVRKIIK